LFEEELGGASDELLGAATPLSIATKNFSIFMKGSAKKRNI
jgi:hypothetical protein